MKQEMIVIVERQRWILEKRGKEEYWRIEEI
jgi:hypothetical protein